TWLPPTKVNVTSSLQQMPPSLWMHSVAAQTMTVMDRFPFVGRAESRVPGRRCPGRLRAGPPRPAAQPVPRRSRRGDPGPAARPGGPARSLDGRSPPLAGPLAVRRYIDAAGMAAQPLEVLDLQQGMDQGFGPRRAARHVHVDGDDGVHAVQHRGALVVRPAAATAAAQGD